MIEHQFGGIWTEQKLEALRGYLEAYQQIFHRNPRARALKTIYVDAFAGTGERDAEEDTTHQLFGYDAEIRGYQEGSAKIALSLQNKFHRYVFLDIRSQHVTALRDLVQREFAELENRCQIERAEANERLKHWCREYDWRA